MTTCVTFWTIQYQIDTEANSNRVTRHFTIMAQFQRLLIQNALKTNFARISLGTMRHLSTEVQKLSMWIIPGVIGMFFKLII